MSLDLDSYRAELGLDQPYTPPLPLADGEVSAATTRLLIAFGVEENTIDRRNTALGRNLSLLRARLTQRPPTPIDAETQTVLDRLLQTLKYSTDVVEVPTIQKISQRFPETAYKAATSTCLWRGDIATLGADAIVNAANSQMLGCFVPFHACIDNAIHWSAGPQLRADCDLIIQAQGYEEPTGTAKATRGWNLPARFVLHTVGPIVRGALTQVHRDALAASYSACLDLTTCLPTVKTLAFCCISTGVFGFPKVDAARIALATVAQWLDNHPDHHLTVVFNVFSIEDERIYADLLRGDP